VPQFTVFQSIWAMIHLPRGGPEWSIHEKLDRIAAAGFAGIECDSGLAIGDAAEIGRLARERGLRLSAGMIVGDREAARREFDWAAHQGAEHVTIQPFGAYLSLREARERLAMLLAVGEEFGLPPTIETHRDRLTQSLPLTAALAEAMPELRFTCDLSHCVVGAEVAWNDAVEFERMIGIVLSRAGHFHGRISNGEQIQIDVGDGSESDDAKRFARWWTQGMREWRARHGADGAARLRFVVELGPYPYSPRAVTPSGRPEGPEFSDRWAQALVMKRLAESCWTQSATPAQS
jgi:sugar phosphate isomerase/epimerase